jgi:hypothetical protein
MAYSVSWLGIMAAIIYNPRRVRNFHLLVTIVM